MNEDQVVILMGLVSRCQAKVGHDTQRLEAWLTLWAMTYLSALALGALVPSQKLRDAVAAQRRQATTALASGLGFPPRAEDILGYLSSKGAVDPAIAEAVRNDLGQLAAP